MKAALASLFAALFVLAAAPAQAAVPGQDGVTMTRSDDSRPETATPTRDPGTNSEEKKPEDEKKPEEKKN